MQCAEFDALLSEALDGKLSGHRFGKLAGARTAVSSCADRCWPKPTPGTG